MNFTMDSENLIFYIRRSTKFESDSQKLAIPRTYVQQILELEHDSPLAGHMGQKITISKIKSKYWWPKMHSDIKTYVRSCEICATMKQKPMTPLVPLHPLPVEDLFHRIQIDHIGPITRTQSGHCHILVITECLSNYTMAIPVRSVDSKTTAKALFYNFVMLFGTPPYNSVRQCLRIHLRTVRQFHEPNQN